MAKKKKPLTSYNFIKNPRHLWDVIVRFKKSFLVAGLVLGILLLVVIVTQSKGSYLSELQTKALSRAATNGVTLAMPTNINAGVNQQINVPITMVTNGYPVIGADYVINFDTSYLRVTGISANLSLKLNQLYPQDSSNTFKSQEVVSAANSSGKLSFSQIVNNPISDTYTGTTAGETVLTIQFQSLRNGTTPLTFQYSPGAKDDTNVAIKYVNGQPPCTPTCPTDNVPQDELVGVSNANVTIGAATVAPSNTPVRTATSVPSGSPRTPSPVPATPPPNSSGFTVNVENPTSKSSVTANGTKEAGTTVFVNGVATSNTVESTSWSYTLQLAMGVNTVTFEAKDTAGLVKSVVTREIVRLGSGDIDGDGKITFRDLLTIIMNFGPIDLSSPTTKRMCDLNGDNNVDVADLIAAIMNQGGTTDPDPTQAPNPSSNPSNPPGQGGFSGVTNGQTVNGVIRVTYNIDSNGIDKVDFYADDTLVNTERLVPYAFGGDYQGRLNGYNTRLLSDGSHTVRVVITRTNGQTSEDSISINVNNSGIGGSTSRPSSSSYRTPSPSRTPSVSRTPAASRTPTPSSANTPMPSMSNMPMPSGNMEVGKCGESMMDWHGPVYNGCQTGHEHGDAPPSWVQSWLTQNNRHLFMGHFNTSAAENTAKHFVMKALSATLKGNEVYFRIHAGSNPGDRSSRYHSYEIWVRDGSGNISHAQGWYNSGDPRPNTQGGSRFVRRQNDFADISQRPIILAPDRTSFAQNVSCEQWYSSPSEPAWSIDFGWTICGATVYYSPNENNNPDIYNPSTWDRTGNLGLTRRLELAWYRNNSNAAPNRGNPPTNVKFWTDQFGNIISRSDNVNPDTDSRCQGNVTMYGQSYPRVCLDQYVASSMGAIEFPGNAIQKTFPGTGVQLPN